MKQDIKFGLYETVWIDVDGESHIGLMHNGEIYDVLTSAKYEMIVLDNQMCVNIDGKTYPLASGSKGISKSSELLAQDIHGVQEYILKRKFKKLYNQNSLTLNELKEYNLLLLELDNFGKEDNVLDAGQERNSRRQAKLKIARDKNEIKKAREEQERKEFLDELFK